MLDLSAITDPRIISYAQRWYPLKSHRTQLALINDNKRFKVVAAGRRSGKTERAKRFIVDKCMKVVGDYFIGAPTRPQVKKIYWEDVKKLSFAPLISTPMESDLIIKYPNGSTLQLIGLDAPSRIEGAFWSGGIIDETDDIKSKAWESNIRPALDTVHPLFPERRAWLWLIGVPEQLALLYERKEYVLSSNDPDWGFYTWKSADILPPDVIDAAKRSMSPKQFRQEYEAAFETVGGRIYEDYSNANLTTETLKPHEQIMWCHDFNYTPMSSAICVRRGQIIYILEEIILTSAVARQSALEFVERYKNHGNKHVIIYGDPAGRAGEKHGHASDYNEMESVLRSAGWQFTRKVKAKAPAIKDRQNAVRAKIASASGEVTLLVNSAACPYAHRGLGTVQLKPGSTFIEEETEYQHITTAIGYMTDVEYPTKRLMDETPVTVIPTIHHFN